MSTYLEKINLNDANKVIQNSKSNMLTDVLFAVSTQNIVQIIIK